MSPIKKLKSDAQRFKADQSLGSGFFSNLRLLLVVDFWPVFWFRMMEYCMESPRKLIFSLKLCLVFLRPFVEGFSGARIRPGAKIGAGFLLHNSVGVIVSSEAIIGDNCSLFSCSCVVHRADGKGLGAPIIGNNVTISVGSIIVGPVILGDNVFVGANSLVLQNIPANAKAVGSPARIL